MPASLGGYQLLERIAVGGMAEVFVAQKCGPQGFEKRVALKRILPHLSGQAAFVTMFLDEARLAAQLSHPNVVQLHDFGVDGNVYYMAMEHVVGEELQALIRRAAERGRPLPVDEAVTLILGACEALHYVHEQGIIHRDVTPSNLLVSYDGVVKLADFGIAKLQTRATHTQAGALKGKIAYMSPEQARGLPLDRRSDVYSLGVCAWELLTLRRLRPESNELHLLAAVQSGVVPEASTVRPIPAALEAILQRALHPCREARFATAREFGEALSEWLGSTVPPAQIAACMREHFGERRPPVSLPTEPTVAVTPLKLPRLKLLLPLLAILLSGGGLLFALRAPSTATAPAPLVLPAARPPARATLRKHAKGRAALKSSNMETEGTSP